MQYDKKTEAALDRFLTAEMGISDRGLRKLKKTNPDRYKREMAGALALASSSVGYRGLVDAFAKNRPWFPSARLSQTIEEGRKDLAKFYEDPAQVEKILNDPSNTYPRQTARRNGEPNNDNFMAYFLANYFEGYYTNNAEALEVWSSMRTIPEAHKRIAVVIVCKTSATAEALREEMPEVVVDLEVQENGKWRPRTITEVIQEVKTSKMFAGFKQFTPPVHTISFDLAARRVKSDYKLYAFSAKFKSGMTFTITPRITSLPLNETQKFLVENSALHYQSKEGRMEISLDFNYEGIPGFAEQIQTMVEALSPSTSKAYDETLEKVLPLITPEYIEHSERNADKALGAVLLLERVAMDMLEPGMSSAVSEVRGMSYDINNNQEYEEGIHALARKGRTTVEREGETYLLDDYQFKGFSSKYVEGVNRSTPLAEVDPAPLAGYTTPEA